MTSKDENDTISPPKTELPTYIKSSFTNNGTQLLVGQWYSQLFKKILNTHGDT